MSRKSGGLLRKVDLNAPLKLNEDSTKAAILQELGVISQIKRGEALGQAYRNPEDFLGERAAAMTNAGNKAGAAYISLYDDLTAAGATVEYAKEKAWELANYTYNSSLNAWDEMHPGMEVVDESMRNMSDRDAKRSRALISNTMNDHRAGFTSLRPSSKGRAKKSNP